MILRESIEARDIIKEIFYLSTHIFGMMPYNIKFHLTVNLIYLSQHLCYFRRLVLYGGEGNVTSLQYSCLENPMDGGAWWAAVHGVTKSQTQLSDFTFTFLHWQPTPVLLPGESQGRRSLVGCRLWGRTESDTTEAT